jgi:eukaryotic-like serine/threonine-protein kinase
MVRDIPEGTLIDGRYSVVERVGSGGMADVYLAQDQQLGRRVAVKLLHRRFAEDREFVERFRREASSAAGLANPNIVGVFDRGEWDGTSYIAMEFLEGRTLKQVILQDAPLDPITAIDLTVQILRAARFAHKRGVIHRDLKPHNVIVDDEGRAKVTDFGIARAGASDMTQTGSIMGTAQYLSPEQAQGHAVTPQSDLYSIGICLYEMLTARLPFDGESAVTIALKQVNEMPIPPGAFNDRVSPELEGVVLHALEKDPTNRFPDADHFIAALEQARANILAGSPDSMTTSFVTVGPPTGGYPVVENDGGGGSSARAWLIALLVMVLLLGGAGLAYALTRPNKREVPNVTGKPVQAALAILQNAGFDPTVERTPSDAEVGIVLRQDPQPNEQATDGAEVSLVVSDGPGTKPVPEVTGQPFDKAQKTLTDAGFKVQQRSANSEDVAKGKVIETSPSAQTPVDVGSTVIVTVSAGREQVAVPNVVGQAREDARSTLEQAGFVVDVKEQEDTSHDPGTVLSQSPAAETKLVTGKKVTITVAKEPDSAAVPNVVGQGVDVAVNTLSDAGFVPNQVTQTVPQRSQDGKVLSQNPVGGTTVKNDSRVTIVVGRYEAPTTPTNPQTTPTTPTTTPTTPTTTPTTPTTTPTTPATPAETP